MAAHEGRIPIVRAVSIFLLFGVVVFAARKPIAWEAAIVVSQRLDSAKFAERFTLVGNGWTSTTISVPVNLIEIDTTKLRYTLMEPYSKMAGVLRHPYSASPLMLFTNGNVQFYRDRDRLVFLDGNKKHYFVVIGTAAIRAR
jgi:hypothetical protein